MSDDFIRTYEKEKLHRANELDGKSGVGGGWDGREQPVDGTRLKEAKLQD